MLSVTVDIIRYPNVKIVNNALTRQSKFFRALSFYRLTTIVVLLTELITPLENDNLSDAIDRRKGEAYLCKWTLKEQMTYIK